MQRGRLSFEAPRTAHGAARLAPQRLCSLSSGLPWFLVPEHGVEDGEKLASNGNEGDHLEFTLSKQVLIKLTQHAVATDGGHRCQEDGGPNAGAATGDLAVPLPLARLSDERGDPNQAGNLTAGQPTELREVGQEHTRNRRADTGKRL